MINKRIKPTLNNLTKIKIIHSFRYIDFFKIIYGTLFASLFIAKKGAIKSFSIHFSIFFR